MAISLLELNTFAHCVSAFFIYGFWWHKPYDVTSHTFLQSKMLDFLFLRRTAVEACRQPGHVQGTGVVDLLAYNDLGAEVVLAKMSLYAHQDIRMTKREKDKLFLVITEQDFICGTGLFFRRSTKPRDKYGHFAYGKSTRTPRKPPTASRFFFLPKQSLVHWQRFWQFTSQNSFSMTGIDVGMVYLTSKSRAPNGSDIMKAPMFNSLASSNPSLGTAISVNIAFIVYGGLHLLAWQYNFRSTTGAVLWKVSAISIASFGVGDLFVVLFCLHLAAIELAAMPAGSGRRTHCLTLTCGIALICMSYVWIPLNLAARTYLFVERFIALPNSPPSTYQIPYWSAYIPHI
jgi:hypothetical protein